MRHVEPWETWGWGAWRRRLDPTKRPGSGRQLAAQGAAHALQGAGQVCEPNSLLGQVVKDYIVSSALPCAYHCAVVLTDLRAAMLEVHDVLSPSEHCSLPRPFSEHARCHQPSRSWMRTCGI